jgi:two-component system, sensor histidine kinase PdtaS
MALKFVNKYFFLLLIVISYLGIAQNKQVDSLLVCLKNAKQDTVKLNVLLQLVEAIPDNKIWSKYNAEAKIISQNLSNSSNTTLSKKGKIGLGSTISNIGFLCEEKGEMPQALERYLESLKIFESIQYEKGISSALNSIAAIYTFQNNSVKALEFCNKSLVIRERIGDKVGMSHTLDNMGTIYMNLVDNGKALEYYYRSLKLREEFGDEYMISYSFNNIGGVYSAMNNLPKAIETHLKSLKIREQLNDEYGMAMSYANLTDVYFKQKKYTKAKLYAEKSLYLIEKSKELRALESIESLLSNIDSASGNYKGALEHYHKYINYRKQTVNSKTEKKLLEKQIQFDYEKKELQLKQEHTFAQEKLLLINESLRKEKIYILLLSLALALIGILSFMAYKRKQKQSHEKSILLQEIHHRVKNNLQIVSSLLNLQTNSSNDEKIVNALKESHNRIKAISLIHEKLYNTNDSANVELKTYIEDLYSKLKTVYNAENIFLTCRVIPVESTLHLETSISVGLILNELFTNTFKYAFPNKEEGSITIDIKIQPNTNCTIVYHDSGIGIAQTINFETSKTLGLRITKELTRKLKGTVSYKNQNGSTFEFNFPLVKKVE